MTATHITAPDGSLWQLVPVEPTPEMQAAAAACWDYWQNGHVIDVMWPDMLAAVPEFGGVVSVDNWTTKAREWLVELRDYVVAERNQQMVPRKRKAEQRVLDELDSFITSQPKHVQEAIESRYRTLSADNAKAICPNCERLTEIRHCQACGCDFTNTTTDTKARDVNLEILNAYTTALNSLIGGADPKRVADTFCDFVNNIKPLHNTTNNT